MRKTKRKKLSGFVRKAIKPVLPDEAEIAVEEANPLYQEIRVDNVLTDEQGEQSKVRPGAQVDVVLEVDSGETMKKEEK